jgi:hypothetical protein
MPFAAAQEVVDKTRLPAVVRLSRSFWSTGFNKADKLM